MAVLIDLKDNTTLSANVIAVSKIILFWSVTVVTLIVALGSSPSPKTTMSTAIVPLLPSRTKVFESVIFPLVVAFAFVIVEFSASSKSR